MLQGISSAASNRENLEGRQHVPALDGLRGCALLMVLVYHGFRGQAYAWELNLVHMGWAGVDLFFVLSGFLITNILLRSRQSNNYFSAFYARRGLRIAPVYYLALIIILLIQPALYHHMHPAEVSPAYTWKQEIWYWLNLSNLRSAWFPVEIPLASVYWSLAIEEQFYAIWPAVVRWLSDRFLTVLCVAGVVLSVVLRSLPLVQHYNAVHTNFISRLTPFRLDGLLAGALLAIFLRHRPSAKHIRAVVATTFVTGIVVLLLASHWLSQSSSAPMLEYGYMALALLFTSILCLCAAPTGAVGRGVAHFFSLKILRNFGKYSYFMYVFHMLIFYSTGHAVTWLLRGIEPVARGYAAALLSIALCYVAGAISWRLMEAPVLRLKSRFPYRFKSRQVQEFPVAAER
jgi:peptidoglycan/LPS O-acetylase OafA/YrhL